MESVLDAALNIAMRRALLCKNAPTCPACNEAHQVQLVYWLSNPAHWRCRTCKHDFAYEPKSTTHR